VSYSLDPNGECASYCEAALEAYGVSSPRVVAERTALDTNSMAASAVNEARVRISHQAQEATRRVLESGQQESAFQERLGDIRAQRIGDNAAAEIASIRPSALVGVGFGRPFHHGTPLPFQPFLFRTVGFTPGQIAHAEFIRQQAASAQVSARRTAQIQAQRAAQIALDKARSLDETAANLQSQMLEASVPGGVSLNPVGTSLYVRNYGP